jgi:hypothetical protein
MAASGCPPAIAQPDAVGVLGAAAVWFLCRYGSITRVPTTRRQAEPVRDKASPVVLVPVLMVLAPGRLFRGPGLFRVRLVLAMTGMLVVGGVRIMIGVG